MNLSTDASSSRLLLVNSCAASVRPPVWTTAIRSLAPRLRSMNCRAADLHARRAARIGVQVVEHHRRRCGRRTAARWSRRRARSARRRTAAAPRARSGCRRARRCVIGLRLARPRRPGSRPSSGRGRTGPAASVTSASTSTYSTWALKVGVSSEGGGCCWPMPAAAASATNAVVRQTRRSMERTLALARRSRPIIAVTLRSGRRRFSVKVRGLG